MRIRTRKWFPWYFFIVSLEVMSLAHWGVGKHFLHFYLKKISLNVWFYRIFSIVLWCITINRNVQTPPFNLTGSWLMSCKSRALPIKVLATFLRCDFITVHVILLTEFLGMTLECLRVLPSQNANDASRKVGWICS